MVTSICRSDTTVSGGELVQESRELLSRNGIESLATDQSVAGRSPTLIEGRDHEPSPWAAGVRGRRATATPACPWRSCPSAAPDAAAARRVPRGIPAEELGLNVEAELDRIASPINVTAMRDMDDADDHPFVEDPVNHAKLAPPRRVPTLQLITKWFAHSVGILGERAPNELPTRNCRCLWEDLGERILRSFRQLDSVGHCGSRPAARISSVTSSSV